MEDLILEKKYSVNDEMFEKAFDFYQRKYVYPRNILISVIHLIAAALNIIGIVKGDSSVLRYVLVCVCFGFAAVNLYSPKKIKRNLMEAVRKLDGEDVYRMRLLPEKIVFGTVMDTQGLEEAEEYEEVFEGMAQAAKEIPESEVYLTRNVIVTERPDFFMVYLKKALFYVIPKADFSEEEITVMKIHFEKQLGKNFRDK